MRADLQHLTSLPTGGPTPLPPCPIPAWVRKEASQVFERIKAALLKGNFAGFLAELHPQVRAIPQEQLAAWFAKLKAAVVEGCKMGKLERKRNLLHAPIAGASDITRAEFLIHDDKVTLINLGKLHPPGR